MIDIILHFDNYLEMVIENYGVLTYLILFLIIFFETGLVVTPFLPGDSLLFIAGAFAAKGAMNVFILFSILAAAAIIGDSVNYLIGRYAGDRIANRKFIKKEYFDRAEKFYEKYGGKTIILARFIPILRTFAPFVAGVGKMEYGKFLNFNIIGGILWTGIFIFGGYYFGRIGFIKENLSLFIIIIIIASIIPIFIEFLRNKLRR